jgi:hypothetical protein
MPYFGGDTKEVTFNNPDLGSRTYQAKSNEGNTADPGGIRTTEVGVTGNGVGMYKKNAIPWEQTVLLAFDSKSDDLDFLASIAGSLKETTITVTINNGAVWQGIGTISGDLKGNTNDSTVPVTLSGGGEFKNIA